MRTSGSQYWMGTFLLALTALGLSVPPAAYGQTAGLKVTAITYETRKWNMQTVSSPAAALSIYRSLPFGTAGYATAPKSLSQFANVSNHVVFGGASTAVGHHYQFAFNASQAGSLVARFGVDFGGGGAVFLDGTPMLAATRDINWNGSFSNAAQYLQISATVAAGSHVIDVYGFDNCCDQAQQAEYNYLGAGFKVFQVN